MRELASAEQAEAVEFAKEYRVSGSRHPDRDNGESTRQDYARPSPTNLKKMPLLVVPCVNRVEG